MADKEASDGKFAVMEKQFFCLGHLWANVSFSFFVACMAACLLYNITSLMAACTGAGMGLLPRGLKPFMSSCTNPLLAA